MQFVRYVGGKEQKYIPWLPSKPVFNRGNRWTAGIPEADAARLMSQSPDLFIVVEGMKDDTGLEEKEEAQMEAEGKEAEEAKEVPPPAPATEPQVLYGTKSNEPFSSKASATRQLPNVSARVGIPVEELEVIELSDGVFVSKKVVEEGPGKIPEGVEMLGASEGVD